MDGPKSRLCRKTARNPSERIRKSSLNLHGTRVLMRGVSGCEDTCTVGDACLERAFHDLHFWESWLSVHLDLSGKRVYTREIHQPIIVLKSQSTIAARPESGFLTSWRRALCDSWYPIMSDGRLKSVNGLEDIELPGRAEQCEVPGAKLPPSVWNMMLSATIRLLPSYVYFEAHSLLYWKSHERYSGFCKHTSFAGYCISRKASRLFGGNASA